MSVRADVEKHNSDLDGEVLEHKLKLICPECGVPIEGQGWPSDKFPQVFCSQDCIRAYHSKHYAPAAGLTSAEIDVTLAAGLVFNAFRQLPQTHPSDVHEVMQHIHAIQNIVMARAAQRAHPEEFPTYTPKEDT